MKKRKKNPKNFSRRQFIGSCAAGVSLLQLAPYLSLTGCTTGDNKYPPIGNRIYHPLGLSEDELKDKNDTYPEVVSDYTDGLKLKISFPGFHSFEKWAIIDPINKKKKRFDYLSINKLGWSNNSGRPELPFFGLLIHIPKFVDYKLNNILPQADEIMKFENIVAYPAQINFYDNIHNPDNYDVFEYDRDYYESDIEPDLKKIVEISEPFDIGFSRFILAKIWPLQFNPGRQYLYGCKVVTLHFKLKIKIPLDDNYYFLETPYLPPDLEYIPEHERIIDPWAAKNPDGSRNVDLIKGLVEGFNPDINKTYVKNGNELLIVYGDNQKISLATPAKRLLEHKTRTMGMTASMSSYSELLTGTLTEDLPAAIKVKREAVFDGDLIKFPVLRNVILFGDLDLVPCGYKERILFPAGASGGSGQNTKVKKFYTDYYNSALKSSENRNEIIIPDIVLGRIPAKNTEEANTVVSNIIHYETSGYQVRRRLTFAGYFQDTGKDGFCCNGIASTNYLQTLEQIRKRLAAINNEISVDTVYEIQEAGFIGPNLRYKNGEYVENPESLFTESEQIKPKILDAFISGNRIILHRNHGYMCGWSRPHFKIPDFWALFQPEKEIPSSVVFSINCLTGHFTGEKTGKLPDRDCDCFAEVLIKGPVLPDGVRRNLRCPAVFAAVEESPTMHNDWLIKSIFDGIYGGIISRTASQGGSIRLGNAVNLGKALLFTCMDDPCLNMYENEIYHVLGDPTIMI